MEKPQMIVGYITMTEIIARLVGRSKNIPVIGTFINDLYAKDYNKHLSWRSKQLVGLFKLLNRLTSKICARFCCQFASYKRCQLKTFKSSITKNKSD